MENMIKLCYEYAESIEHSIMKHNNGFSNIIKQRKPGTYNSGITIPGWHTTPASWQTSAHKTRFVHLVSHVRIMSLCADQRTNDRLSKQALRHACARSDASKPQQQTQTHTRTRTHMSHDECTRDIHSYVFRRLPDCGNWVSEYTAIRLSMRRTF